MKFILKYVVLAFCYDLLNGFQFRCDYKYTCEGLFKYHEIPATWYDARLQCHLEGGILASPTTPGIKSFMLASFCKPEIFTGIHATYSKGLFHTIDGIPLAKIPYSWAPSEPDNKNNDESCLSLNADGKLADVSCDKPLPYICHIEHSNIDHAHAFSICGTSDPEYHFYTETNKCYKFHTIPRTFARAQFTCSAEGGHLAIINSDEEAKVMSTVYNKYPSATMIGNFYKELAIIGFSNGGDNQSTDWTTIHGQSLKDTGYAKFAKGQPDISGENCGSIFRDGLLNDVWCTNPYAFICEKSPDYPAICDSVSVHIDSIHVDVRSGDSD